MIYQLLFAIVLVSSSVFISKAISPASWEIILLLDLKYCFICKWCIVTKLCFSKLSFNVLIDTKLVVSVLDLQFKHLNNYSCGYDDFILHFGQAIVQLQNLLSKVRISPLGIYFLELFCWVFFSVSERVNFQAEFIVKFEIPFSRLYI